MCSSLAISRSLVTLRGTNDCGSSEHSQTDGRWLDVTAALGAGGSQRHVAYGDHCVASAAGGRRCDVGVVSNAIRVAAWRTDLWLARHPVLPDRLSGGKQRV